MALRSHDQMAINIGNGCGQSACSLTCPRDRSAGWATDSLAHGDQFRAAMTVDWRSRGGFPDTGRQCIQPRRISTMDGIADKDIIYSAAVESGIIKDRCNDGPSEYLPPAQSMRATDAVGRSASCSGVTGRRKRPGWTICTWCNQCFQKGQWAGISGQGRDQRFGQS